MKRKVIFSVIVASMVCVQAYAGDGVTLIPRLSIGSVAEATAKNYSTTYSDYSHPMAYIYSDTFGRIKTCGNITGSLDIIFTKRIALSVDLGATILWKDQYDGITNQATGVTKVGAAVHLIPQFRFYYLNKPVVRLYGSAGVGLTTYFGEEFYDYFAAAGQFSPFGIELGRKLFGFAECGVGTAYSGIRGGIGYKF